MEPANGTLLLTQQHRGMLLKKNMRFGAMLLMLCNGFGKCFRSNAMDLGQFLWTTQWIWKYAFEATQWIWRYAFEATQWIWSYAYEAAQLIWSNSYENAMGLDVLMKQRNGFWNFAYEANNGFKKQCNWFGGMLIDNTIDLKLCLWSNAINLEQFLWNAMNLEICLDVDSIVELCLWINTIDFELCLQSNTMDFAAAQWIWSCAYEAAHLIWSCAYEARQ